MKTHRYFVDVVWTGNLGAGTRDYRAYDRSHEIRSAGKATILGSSDPAFRGDPLRWNPEELFVSTISTCHQLWYLHFCASSNVTVISYEDRAEGVMEEDGLNGGRFTSVTLRPRVAITAGSDESAAREAHERAHQVCFIANSVNVTISVEPEIVVEANA